ARGDVVDVDGAAPGQRGQEQLDRGEVIGAAATDGDDATAGVADLIPPQGLPGQLHAAVAGTGTAGRLVLEGLVGRHDLRVVARCGPDRCGSCARGRARPSRRGRGRAQGP